MRKPLSLPDMMRIAAEAIVDLRTVERTYSGAPVRSTTFARITKAAHLLRLPLPGVANDDELEPTAA